MCGASGIMLLRWKTSEGKFIYLWEPAITNYPSSSTSTLILYERLVLFRTVGHAVFMSIYFYILARLMLTAHPVHRAVHSIFFHEYRSYLGSDIHPEMELAGVMELGVRYYSECSRVCCFSGDVWWFYFFVNVWVVGYALVYGEAYASISLKDLLLEMCFVSIL